MNETLQQANDRLMDELAQEVAKWQELANEQERLINSLGGRRNPVRHTSTKGQG
jgi:hypothetical protein